MSWNADPAYGLKKVINEQMVVIAASETPPGWGPGATPDRSDDMVVRAGIMGGVIGAIVGGA